MLTNKILQSLQENICISIISKQFYEKIIFLVKEINIFKFQ